MLRIAIFLAAAGLVLGADERPVPVFVTSGQHDRYAAMIPAGIFTAAEKARLVFYDQSSTVQAFQEWTGGGLNSWHPVARNISANRSEPHGNANREFPWLTGGLDKSPEADSFKALLLPPGKRMKGYWRTLSHTNGHGNHSGYSTGQDRLPSMLIEYPIGARLVEVLYFRESRKAFEVRIMEKVRNDGLFATEKNWRFRWFRPVRDSDHLLELTKGTQYAKQLRRHYRETLGTERLTDANHDGAHRAFNRVSPVDQLPRMPAGTVARLLSRPFAEVTDRPWVETVSGKKGYAARGGVFPAGYQGTHFSSKECIACHRTVARHANDFQLFRDWYGRVRGSDSVFSLVGVDAASVSATGFPVRPAWSRKMIRAGLLEAPR